MDLFEYLKNCVGCTFISDLRFGIYRDKAIELLKSMDISMYEQKQIDDISAYFGIALV